jgi:hypothetical protein
MHAPVALVTTMDRIIQRDASIFYAFTVLRPDEYLNRVDAVPHCFSFFNI